MNLFSFVLFPLFYRLHTSWGKEKKKKGASPVGLWVISLTQLSRRVRFLGSDHKKESSCEFFNLDVDGLILTVQGGDSLTVERERERASSISINFLASVYQELLFLQDCFVCVSQLKQGMGTFITSHTIFLFQCEKSS